MRFWFTEEQEKFRQEIRGFLQAELKAGSFVTKTGGSAEVGSQELSRKMAQRGWIGMTWPKQYGGQGRPYVDRMILNEEVFKVQAPMAYHFFVDRQVGPSIIHFGSEWQKEYFLPRFVRADDNMRFCLLFSEPNAGSDMVNVSTSATKDGDSFIIRGQKVWIGSAEFRFPLIDEIALFPSSVGIRLGGFRGAVFADFGSAWDEQYVGTIGSVGAGVRLNFARMLVFRYDIGKRIELNLKQFQEGFYHQFFFGWDF